jgi:excisionase family DNA binding protein
MVSNSRRAKPIDGGSREASASEVGCHNSREQAVGSTRSAADPQEPGSNMPIWIASRHIRVLKDIPHQDAISPSGAEEFMTIREAASALRISERTVRRHLAEGRIPHIRAGKQIRIPRAGLMRGWSKE